LQIRALVEAFVARARTNIDLVQDASLFRPNDAPLLVGDHARLSAATGWQPQILIENTVEDLLDHWRKRQNGSA
jgi:GDP-4-dehydro-6-deoxy-D-mannose reductase